MKTVVGLLCFSWLLATGTCLECEHCSAFKEDCTGKLEVCGEDQDTCATIRTETIIGKSTSFTIVKSCYQSSNCLRSSKGNSLIKVNVNIECSASPAEKVESEGAKPLDLWSNDLPDNQLLAEGVNQPKPRAAAAVLNRNLGNPKTGGTIATPNPTTGKTVPTPGKTEPTSGKPKPTSGKPEPTSEKPTPTPEKPKTTPLIETTTGDNAHQTIASFFLALTSLLLMNIIL